MNYQHLYTNFKQYSDVTEEEDAVFFQKATPDELASLTACYDICVSDSSVWEKEDLTALKEIVIPSQLIHFYQKLNPVNLPMNDSYVNLADLQRIREEYTFLAPGCYLIKWGFLVIGTTIGGNPILIDLNESALPVYAADHTLLMDNGTPGKIKLSFAFPPAALRAAYHDADIPVTYQTILKCLCPIEARFDDFIEKLSCNSYPDIEDLLDEMDEA